MRADVELKQLAALALRNAFWRDFSALVNTYLGAAKGLDIPALEMQMGELTSVYGRDKAAESTQSINIWTQNGASKFSTSGHGSVLEALEYEPATEVHFAGAKVFERKDGEWMFVVDTQQES